MSRVTKSAGRIPNGTNHGLSLQTIPLPLFYPKRSPKTCSAPFSLLTGPLRDPAPTDSLLWSVTAGVTEAAPQDVPPWLVPNKGRPRPALPSP